MKSVKQKDLEKILARQSGIARKVYEATPISEGWRIFKISSELKRNTGSSVDVRTITACLMDMADQGILVKTGSDAFQRAVVVDNDVVKAAVIKPTSEVVKVAEQPVVEKPSTDKSLVDSVSEFSVKLRRMAKELDSLANNAEELGLLVLKEQEEIETKSKALNDLRSLLKILG